MENNGKSMEEEWYTYIYRDDETPEKEHIYQRVYVQSDDLDYFLRSLSCMEGVEIVERLSGKIEPVEKEVTLKGHWIGDWRVKLS